MQKESRIQVNLRERIQTFLYAFKEENDLGNVIPDCDFLYNLIKKGIIINQSQIPDLYAKLQIPIDKRKAFYFDDLGIDYSEKASENSKNSFFKRKSYFKEYSKSDSNFSSDIKFHLKNKEGNKFNKRINLSNFRSSDYNCSYEIILFPLVPYRINLNSKLHLN